MMSGRVSSSRKISATIYRTSLDDEELDVIYKNNAEGDGRFHVIPLERPD